jgi:hypothetical protein
MKTKLIEVGLWDHREKGEPGRDISSAWSILSRLGCPGRYCGRTQDGLYEYMIVDPKTGSLLTSGEGITLARAMCDAASAASTLEIAHPGLGFSLFFEPEGE